MRLGDRIPGRPLRAAAIALLVGVPAALYLGRTWQDGVSPAAAQIEFTPDVAELELTVVAQGPVPSEIQATSRGDDLFSWAGALFGAGLIALISTIRGARMAMKSARAGQSSEDGPSVRQPPPLGVLVGIAILLHIVTVIVDAGLVGGEFAGAILEPGPISEFFLAGAALFITNLDIAFSVYVYRVFRSTKPADVRLDLNPLNLWGLRQGAPTTP